MLKSSYPIYERPFRTTTPGWSFCMSAISSRIAHIQREGGPGYKSTEKPFRTKYGTLKRFYIIHT